MIRTYSELMRLKTFEEKFRYLKLDGKIGEETFGFDRYLNQQFYRSSEWKSLRNKIIVRDDGCDLGDKDRPIIGKIIIHHMNGVTIEDIVKKNADILDPEFLICASENTHHAIHYSDEKLLIKDLVVRKPNDTCPWK